LACKLDYLQEEVRVLREVFAETGRKRIPFTDDQRHRLAIEGKVLTPDECESCCQLVRPSTILDWFRKLTAQSYDGSAHRRKPGRPRKAADIRELVTRLATRNKQLSGRTIVSRCASIVAKSCPPLRGGA
jgi:hypothetical protein